MNGFSQAFVAAAELVSQWTIPGVILLIVLAAWWRSVPMYESFITGAKEGFGVVGAVGVFDEGRTPLPRVVAFARFDLDHLGAKVGKELSRPWPREHPGELEDSQARKRRRGFVLRQCARLTRRPGCRSGRGRGSGRGCRGYPRRC